jgi:hypothetical protein
MHSTAIDTGQSNFYSPNSPSGTGSAGAHIDWSQLLVASALGGHDDLFACIYPLKQHGELCLVCADGDVHAG